MATLSKSKYLAGLQCRKLLWYHFNEPAVLPPPDADKQAIFDAGHAVGDLAKALHPDGVEVPWTGDLAQTVAATRDLLIRRHPVFEASFAVDGCYCRADILVPAAHGAWDLYEVKSATSVKHVNIEDVAFQAHLCERSGVALDRLFVMHVDNRYVRQGAVDPSGLLRAADVTDRARAIQPQVVERAAALQEVIAGPCPGIPIGPQCHDPYGCDLRYLCTAFLPANDVTQLHRLRKLRIYDLIARGITALVDVPDHELRPTHHVQREAVLTGRRQVMVAPLRAWLAGLSYPLHFLDFETMQPAVPLLDGTRPYQHVPFQFSLHIVDHEGAAPRHVEFLADSPEDPRPALIAALQTAAKIATVGTVLAYHMTFERGVLNALAAVYPEHCAFLEAISARCQDLEMPFEQFWVYDAAQRGSCSLKAVLPALTGISYADLAITDGRHAAREFVRVVFGDATGAAGAPAHDKAAVLQDLREYCRQDTWAMVELLRVLRGLVG